MMAKHEFSGPIAIDFAPVGSACEWCGKPAEYELTAIGGARHNMSGLFCRSCGNEFIKSVTGDYDLDMLRRELLRSLEEPGSHHP